MLVTTAVRVLLSALLLGVAIPAATASGIAFRLILGAPPDPNYQEVGGDGNAALPPRGYSPGYGYPSSYMNMPSLVITHERHGPAYLDPAIPPPDWTASVPPSAVLVRVLVPADAQVWFSGDATTQRGSARLFVTPPLSDGQVLTYDVRASWLEQGKTVVRTQRVVVHPGDRVTVDLLTPEADLPAPRRVEQP